MKITNEGQVKLYSNQVFIADNIKEIIPEFLLLLKGVVDFKAVFAELDKIGYKGPFTVEMIPFCRLPDLVLPDQALADKMAVQLATL